MATTPQRKTSLMDHNLKVLQRSDPDTNTIVVMAYHTVVYKMNDETKAWDREDVEGALFLVTRTTEPWHRIVVRNRQSATDLVQDVDSSFVYEIKDPYLMFQNNEGVRCLWIPEAQDREEVFQCFGSSIGPQYMPKFQHPPVYGSLRKQPPPSPKNGSGPTTPLLHPSHLLSRGMNPSTPSQFKLSANENVAGDCPVLTKNELRDALVSLLEHDQNFLDVIHRQYLNTRHNQNSDVMNNQSYHYT